MPEAKPAKKIILALAPTGGWGAGRNNPLDPGILSREVIACARAGASLVHLHARDGCGALTTDLSLFLETTRRIHQGCDIIIEASTGGLSQLSAEERALPLKSPEAETGSLNMGSLNFLDNVYRNSLPDIRLWLGRMKERGVLPCLEIFDTSHLLLTTHLIGEGLISTPLVFNFVFNYRWGMGFSLPLLGLLKQMLPRPSLWGAVFGSSEDFSLHLQAALHGAGMVRVGFEDSPLCEGREAASNLELVQELRRRLEILGFRPASPEEARTQLNLAPLERREKR